MSAAEIAVPVVPLRRCAPWCDDGDGHADEHPDDRSCWSAFEIVGLSHRSHRPSHYTDGTWRRPYLNVYLRWLPEDHEPIVVIHSEETDQELRLSRDEARRLRDVLDDLLERSL